VYHTISAYVLEKARLTRSRGATGAVTLIQRFGSALNRQYGAYLVGTEPPMFRPAHRAAGRGRAEVLVERGAGWRYRWSACR
jgi:hypothetical protein